MKSIAHLRSATLFVPFLCSPPMLLATSGEWWVPIVAKAVNLILFFSVLYFLLRKPIREFFATRRAEVRATLDRAAQEKAAADEKMIALNARLNKLDNELADIRTQAEREAQAERVRMEAEAKVDAEKLRSLASREIEGAKQSALVQLREFTADKAVALAEQMIRKELTPQDDARLLQRVGAELTKVS